MNGALDFVRDHGALFIAVLAVIEAFFVATVLRRVERLKARLRLAATAAEDAARAAALAAPGGIDPEVVIQLLRNGRQTSLESVYQLMEQQAAAADAARDEATANAAHEAAAKAARERADAAQVAHAAKPPAASSATAAAPTKPSSPPSSSAESESKTDGKPDPRNGKKDPPSGDNDEMSKRLGRYG